VLKIESLKFILVFGVSFLFIVLPSINHTDYAQSTISSKFIFFIFSSLALFGVYVLAFVLSKQKKVQISKSDMALFLLAVYFTINRYFIQDNYGFSIRYIELLSLGILFIILRSIPYKNFVWLFLAIIISGIIQAVYGNLQLLGIYPSNHSGFKITGSFFNPGPYAGFLVVVWSFALGFYLFKDKMIELVNPKKKKRFLNILVSRVFEYIPLISIISIGSSLNQLLFVHLCYEFTSNKT